MHIHFDSATPFYRFSHHILALVYKDVYRMFIAALSVRIRLEKNGH